MQDSERAPVSPSQQLATHGDDVSGATCRRCRFQNEPGAGRCARCRSYLKLNPGPRTHGAFVVRLDSAVRDDALAVLRSRGFDDDDPVMRPVATSFVHAVMVEASCFEFIAKSGGPISGKGNTRRAVVAWSRAQDRVAKLAAMLGLQPRAKKVQQTPAEWLASLDTTTTTEDTESESTDDTPADDEARQAPGRR